MRKIIPTVFYATLIFTIIYFGINHYKLYKTCKNNVQAQNELDDLQFINQNLSNSANNALQIEYLFHNHSREFLIEDEENNLFRLNEFLLNNPNSLILCIDQNSCSSCIEKEFRRLQSISDSLPLHYISICKSDNWRNIKLIKRNNNIESKFFRMIILDDTINENLFENPFYFYTFNTTFGLFFIPLNEEPVLTKYYFEIIKEMLIID